MYSLQSWTQDSWSCLAWDLNKIKPLSTLQNGVEKGSQGPTASWEDLVVDGCWGKSILLMGGVSPDKCSMLQWISAVIVGIACALYPRTLRCLNTWSPWWYCLSRFRTCVLTEESKSLGMGFEVSKSHAIPSLLFLVRACVSRYKPFASTLDAISATCFFCPVIIDIISETISSNKLFHKLLWQWVNRKLI